MLACTVVSITNYVQNTDDHVLQVFYLCSISLYFSLM